MYKMYKIHTQPIGYRYIGTRYKDILYTDILYKDILGDGFLTAFGPQTESYKWHLPLPLPNESNLRRKWEGEGEVPFI